MYYMCTSMQAFLFFYFRDVMEAQEESLTRWRLGILVLIAMLVGLCTALPAGYISEWIGRKPVVYFSTSSMAVAYLIFAFAPFFGPQLGLYIVYCGAGIFYGMGSGAFQSVDYALALDVLPKDDGSSRVKGSSEALATWGIAEFLGASMGPLIGGVALEATSTEGMNLSSLSVPHAHGGSESKYGHYTHPGYIFIGLLGASCALLCAL